nr:hypothetical protein CFP56_52507 [Quercus suber]
MGRRLRLITVRPISAQILSYAFARLPLDKRYLLTQPLTILMLAIMPDRVVRAWSRTDAAVLRGWPVAASRSCPITGSL